MNVWRLILREISHRKLNFVMGLVSVAVAVGCFVGARTLLRADEIQTEQAGKALEDSMRKITKGLGFNILILPEDQDVNELHTEGTLSKSMPYEYVERLANSKIVTINHLLPLVIRKVRMSDIDKIELGPAERQTSMFVIGTHGEVPLVHRDMKKPLEDHVPPGTMVVGFQIGKKLELKPSKKKAAKKKSDKKNSAKGAGQKEQPNTLETVNFLGREFKITKVKAELGNRDDSTIWINLSEAQEMFDSKNLVNGILALECNCATIDRVAEIRKDLEAILPGTQVIESGPPALARAEARNLAKQMAVKNLEQHQSFASILVPLVVIGCGAWIGLLAFGNVRQRSSEIGILRAIGLRSMQILLIFLGKAILIGLIGAIVGYAAGFGIVMSMLPESSGALSQLFAPELLVATLLIAPTIAALASWIPAMLASRQDPAMILQAD